MGSVTRERLPLLRTALSLRNYQQATQVSVIGVFGPDGATGPYSSARVIQWAEVTMSASSQRRAHADHEAFLRDKDLAEAVRLFDQGVSLARAAEQPEVTGPALLAYFKAMERLARSMTPSVADDRNESYDDLLRRLAAGIADTKPNSSRLAALRSAYLGLAPLTAST